MHDNNTEIMNAAFEWCAVLADDQASDADRLAFRAWLKATPGSRAAFEQAQLFWQDLGALKQADLDEEFFKASWRERTRSVMMALVRSLGDCLTQRPVSAAGSVVAALVLAVVVLNYAPGDQPHMPLQEHAYATGIGEIRNVPLGDGTTITLGPDTTVIVRLDDDSRQVRMSEGEAFFQVAKDQSRPFVVTSGDLRVTVHGTAFNVRRNDQSANVAVTEGVVSVAYGDAEPTELSADSPLPESPAAGAKTLTVGEQYTVLRDSGPEPVASVEPETVGAWRSHQLVYIDAPLSEIVSDINRYRSRKIHIREQDVRDTRVTATFSSDNIHDLLQTLTRVLSLRLEATPEGDELRTAG